MVFNLLCFCGLLLVTLHTSGLLPNNQTFRRYFIPSSYSRPLVLSGITVNKITIALVAWLLVTVLWLPKGQ